jgi:uncharacterized protein
MSDAASTAEPAADEGLPRGRTAALDREEAGRLFHEGVAHFNGVRYWHAHESWETLWRAADEDDRDFYQGLIQVAAGLLHLQRRNLRGAQLKLEQGTAKLRRYEPAHRGIFVNELIGQGVRLLEALNQGALPYLIPPVIRFTDSEDPDFSR